MKSVIRNRVAGTRRVHLSRRRALGLQLALLTTCVAAVPGAALAATPKSTTFKYNVPVKTGILARGSNVVAAGKVTSPMAKVNNWWSAGTIRTIVQKGVNNARQIPYVNNGYRCTPTIKGQNTNFVCSMTGADVPTSVTFRYSIVYRGDTASG